MGLSLVNWSLMILDKRICFFLLTSRQQYPWLFSFFVYCISKWGLFLLRLLSHCKFTQKASEQPTKAAPLMYCWLNGRTCNHKLFWKSLVCMRSGIPSSVNIHVTKKKKKEDVNISWKCLWQSWTPLNITWWLMQHGWNIWKLVGCMYVRHQYSVLLLIGCY